MLARKFRLRRSKDCQHVWQSGRSVQVPELRLKFCRRQEQPVRVAVVVGKKVLKLAVQRNRLRRRLGEIIRLNFALVPPRLDLLVIAKTAKVCELSSPALTEVLQTLLQRISVPREVVRLK